MVATSKSVPSEFLVAVTTLLLLIGPLDGNNYT